jgi:hypothetical protein
MAEGIYIANSYFIDSFQLSKNFGGYVYLGYRFNKKYVVYGRYDVLEFGERDMYFGNRDFHSDIVGARYEINYLNVVKIEFVHNANNRGEINNFIQFQYAFGF